MLKRFLILICVICLLCSCTTDNREIVTFSSWGSATEFGILKQIILNFEKENPNIKIRFLHIPQNYFQKIHLLFASNTAPDVIFINNLFIPVYENQLIDLSDIIDKKEFYPQGIEALSLNNKLLAVPRDISNLVFYYNKNFVKSEPKSFEEFDKEIKKLSSPNLFGVSYEQNIFYAEPYILTLGSQNGLDYYLKLEGKYAPKPSDSGSLTQAQMFLNEKTAFYLSGRWMYPKLIESAKFDIGIMPFCGIVYSDASGWAISNTSKHKESAKKFIKYLSSKKGIDYFTSTGLIVPARLDSAKILENDKEQPFLDAISKSKSRMPDKNYAKNRDRINKEIFK